MHPIGKGFMIATAVATMAIGGSLQAMAQDKAQSEPVKCAGLNACKGQGSCKSAGNDCKGKNACKGTSYLETKTVGGVRPSAAGPPRSSPRWRSRCRTWATASVCGRRTSRGSGTAPRASTGSR